MIGADVEGPAFVVEDAVEGVAGDQLEVVLAAASGCLPDFVEYPGGGDNGRPTVKSVAVDVVDVGAAAQFVAFFEEFDLVAAGCEAGGGAETAEPGADDDNPRHSYPPLDAAGAVIAPTVAALKDSKEIVTQFGLELRTRFWFGKYLQNMYKI